MANGQQLSLDQLGAILRALPKEIASNRGGPLKRALFVIAKRLRDEARTKAPYKTGRLQRSVIVKRDPNPRQINNANERYVVSVKRGPRKNLNTAFYGGFVHWGTGQGKQGPDTGRKFIEDTWEANKSRLLQEFTDELSKGLGRALRRAKRAR